MCQIDAQERGIAIESILAKTEYGDWFNCGQLDNGTFPIIDFQKDLQVVSLKTIDPRLSSYKGDKTTKKILEYLENLDRKIKVGDSYDSVGRLTKTEKPDGSIDIKTFDGSGCMISDREVNSKGETILNYEYAYDSFGNITSIKNCLEDGEEISYSSEANGVDASVSEDDENTVTSLSMEY